MQKIQDLNEQSEDLEQFLIQEIQDLRDDMVTKFQSLKDTLSETSDAEAKDAKLPGNEKSIATRCPRDLPKVPFPGTMTERPASQRNQTSSTTRGTKPIPMTELKGIKQAMVAYGVHSPYVKELLSTWATANKITPLDWNNLISAVLDQFSQIKWKALWRQEAKALELQGLKDGFEASQSKIIGEGEFADPQIQAGYDEHTFYLCQIAALNALNKVREPGERVESYSKVTQGPRERFSEFLQRLSRAIDLQITDPNIRRLLTESLAYENANPQYKQILWPLKIRSAPLEEWVLYTANIETGTWVGEAIYKGLKQHQDDRWPNHEEIKTWVGEAIYRSFKRHQNPRCFNCGRIGHLSRNCRQYS